MKLPLTLMLLVLLTSCGKSSHTTEGSYSSAYGSSNPKVCNTNVISDYDKLVRVCKIKSDDDVIGVFNCIEQADVIYSNYPGVNCTVPKTSMTSTEEDTVVINSESIKEVQNGYTYENYLNYKDGNPCGKYFIHNLNFIINTTCKGFDFTNKDEVRTCAEAVEGILTIHPELNCSTEGLGKNGELEPFFYTFSEIKEIHDSLLEILN